MSHTHAPLHYYGHGKLMLTGEYFVLDGAKALAIPTRYGQHLRCSELTSVSNILYWVALNHLKQPWLTLTFDKTTFNCLHSDSKEAQTLSTILTQARVLNPTFLTQPQDTAIETFLEFPNEWGLGSSSTLIHCIAALAQVDGFTLMHRTIGGSGYDVACGGSPSPIVYQLQAGVGSYEPVLFSPPFQQHLYFAYTGQKQLSSAGIVHYHSTAIRKQDTIVWLNTITEAMLQCQSLAKMEQLIAEHESIISDSLSLPKVKDRLFPHYWGAVKSLGAWGGDFVMLTNDHSEEEFAHYLHSVGITVYSSYDSMRWKLP